MIKLLTRFIPGYVEFRSLYWINVEKKMNDDLVRIFSMIDKDKYNAAQFLIDNFERTYDSIIQGKMPKFVIDTYTEISRAKMIVDIMMESEAIA